MQRIRPIGRPLRKAACRWYLLAAATSVGLITLALFLLSDRTTLEWVSGDRSVSVRVTATSPDFIGRSKSHLEVTHHAVTRSVQLDDDAHLGFVSIVSYQDWILIAADDMILGGFNLRTDQILGENQWRGLPFTVWQGGGLVLNSGRFTRQAFTPASFPYHPELGKEQ